MSPQYLKMSSENLAQSCWYLTGPTATDKTRIGIALAQQIDAEIISLDSMALYRGMEIGTAKPTAEQRQQAVHHLLDIADVEEDFSVAKYVELASEKASEIHGRGHQVLFVGGTPLYLKAMLRGLFQGPEADWEFREQIEQELLEVGQEALYERLQQVDPLSAAKLHPNDTRRLIRALEVYKITGQPISHMQMEFEEGLEPEQCKVFALQRPIDQLHQRIDRRVESMFASGLIEEVQQLTADGRQLGRTASQAVGYSEVLQHLAGQADLPETIEKVKVRTRRFAKRQRTWFRSLSECRHVTVAEDAQPESVAEEIVRMVEAG